MKKKIIIIASFLLICVCVFILNPFFWGMQSNKVKQPELSKDEKLLFSGLKKLNGCEINRFYHNYFAEGDTLNFKYKKNDFEYCVEITSSKKKDLILNNDSTYNLALLLKNTILKRNCNLKKIKIYKVLIMLKTKETEENRIFDYSYDYDCNKDKLTESK
ncbi:hypothetical protein EZL74_11095 [Flavobacterium silvisoli]|uniref:Uncharacterized protein n=1 Tax=Flavobacterium silvisoli TaxID=2529433 RepID=A0A4Q9YRH1_9FLAO|nr:hypothetical protein [Flavobacterium silvisoli]TBX66127.1 hypothetical protein EZL74_11095 [Flavobacterium silvisoli]